MISKSLTNGLFALYVRCGCLLLLLWMVQGDLFAAGDDAAFPNGRLVIISGDVQGVYHQFSNDLRMLGQLHGFEIIIKPSMGSLDNLVSIVNDDGVHMAWVQADIPSWIAARLRHSDRPGNEVRKFLVKVRTLYSVYDESVQVIARREIKGLSDLKGRRVSAGLQKSGTFLTMGNIFQKEGLHINSVPLAMGEALTRLRSGELDAVAMVSGYPVSALQSFDEKDYHLLPVVLTHADPVYHTSEIPANTYRWQNEAVKTISVKALLATYEYSRDMPVCQRLIKFTDVLRKNLDWLRANGHAGWQRVNFEYDDNEGKNFLRSHCISGY